MPVTRVASGPDALELPPDNQGVIARVLHGSLGRKREHQAGRRTIRGTGGAGRDLRYAALLNVPDAPVALVQVAAFHVTSAAPHVVPPTTGGVNDAAFASSETRICLVAVASTMFWTVTDAAVAAVLEVTLVTLNVTPAGTVTLACSLTVAVSVVVWLVSVKVTDCCAKAGVLPSSIAPTTDTRTHSFLIQNTPPKSSMDVEPASARQRACRGAAVRSCGGEHAVIGLPSTLDSRLPFGTP